MNKNVRTAAALLVFAAAAGTATATAQATTEPPAPAANPEFCEAFTALDLAVAAIPEDPAEAEEYVATNVAPNLATVLENAPTEIAEDVQLWGEIAQQFVATGDESLVQSPEFAAASGALYTTIKDSCGLPVVEAALTDYAFGGVPETIEAGTTLFFVHNNSESGELHEMVIFNLADTVDPAMAPMDFFMLPEEEMFPHVESVSGAVAAPGQVAGTIVDLQPGRYFYVCFIPVGSVDGARPEDAPPHLTEGMIGEFTVEGETTGSTEMTETTSA